MKRYKIKYDEKSEVIALAANRELATKIGRRCHPKKEINAVTKTTDGPDRRYLSTVNSPRRYLSAPQSTNEITSDTIAKDWLDKDIT